MYEKKRKHKYNSIQRQTPTRDYGKRKEREHGTRKNTEHGLPAREDGTEEEEKKYKEIYINMQHEDIPTNRSKKRNRTVQRNGHRTNDQHCTIRKNMEKHKEKKTT